MSPRVQERSTAHRVRGLRRNHASIGVALALGTPPEEIVDVLRQVQNDLSTPARISRRRSFRTQIPPLRVTEAYIDASRDGATSSTSASNRCTRHPAGGTPLGALLHSSRTIARRAERSAWAAVEASPDDQHPACEVPHRLSDLLFIVSRLANPGGDVL
ncbi:hypothetical protein GS940_16405, partial [Rhodococcus hoagii]|nr:hypothetical protein [Prescottella equi]